MDKTNDEILGFSDKIKIELKIYIEYDEHDSLERLSELMLNLNPEDNVVILSFGYELRPEKIDDLKTNFTRFQSIEGNSKKTLIDYLKKNISTYYHKKIRSLEFGNEVKSVVVKNIDTIIKFESIGAKRRVSEEKNSYNLSTIVSSYYQKNVSQDAFLEKKEVLEASLSEIDETLNKHYPTTFEDLLNALKQFGINSQNSTSEIQIKSDISSNSIITNNSAVVYEQSDYQLPENYNGLGYINLIYMILEIYNKLGEFKASDDKKDASINLLFLEEPEAHMHPQMQYVFIHHIKEMLANKSKELDINLQAIISTHSAHIASQSEFNDIKYFDISGENHIEVKSLSEFLEIESPDNIRFLKKYLTVKNSELLFADKAILIEGTTERLLLPFMMDAIDNVKVRVEDEDTGEFQEVEKAIEDRLLSQYISVIEVGGAYAHIFKKLLKFLDIKTLIITDLDSIKPEPITDKNGVSRTSWPSCPVAEGEKTSNKAIEGFLGEKSLAELINLSNDDKVVEDLFRVAYQIPDVEDGYNARSFEDAWIEINEDFINSDQTSLSIFPEEVDVSGNSYSLAKKIDKKKTEFALDILFSTSDENQWQTPRYIREGLEWLAC